MMRTQPLSIALLGTALLLAGCCCGDAGPAATTATTAETTAEPTIAAPAKDADAVPEIERHRKWSENVGQGAQPVGDAAFARIKALGYTTVLSVDGAVPDVEAAAKHGLTYVHVPIGYDGISKEQALQIVATGERAEGPVFVHCHHGKHRGPAAAMLLRICEDKISNEQAMHEMEISKTSKRYTGLYRDVKAFRAPSADALATVKALPSKVLPKGLRAGMVDVNLRWDHLKISKLARWKQPADHPDIAPAHEARMLWELYREMGRNDKESRDKGEIFLAYLKEGEDAAIALEKAIRAGDAAAADKQFGVLKDNCAACHRDYRDYQD